MRLKKLEIHNIASIADASIDFESAPLSDADVFLITGNTGAGKSTLLDAICLALFNNAPRLEATLMEGRVDTSNNPSGVALSDPRQLLRRGTGEGRIKLEFEGNNGRNYIATWSVQRAWKKPNGRLQDVVRTLVCDDVTIGKHDLAAELSSAVGMSFQQFCRTTMLAQGQFTRFLNSKDRDKAEILEQILDVNVYATISRGIYERYAAETEKQRKLHDEAGNVKVLTHEEIAEAEARAAVLAESINQLGAAQKSERARLDWHRQYNALIARRALATENLAKAEAMQNDDKVKRATRLVADMKACAVPCTAIDDLKQARKSLAEILAARRVMAANFAELAAGANDLEDRLNVGKKNLTAMKEWEADNNVNINDAAQLPAIESELRRLAHIEAQYAKNKGIVESETPKLSSLESIAASKRLTADQNRKIFTNYEAAQLAAEQALANENPAGQRARHTELTVRLAAIEQALQQATLVASHSAQLESSDADLAALRIEYDKAATECAAAYKDEELQARLFEEAENAFKKASESMSDWSRRVRAELKPGDVCPVCRHRIQSAIDSDDTIANALQPLKQRCNELKAEHNRALNALNEAKVKAATLLNRIKDTEKTLAQKTRQLNEYVAGLAVRCEKLGVAAEKIEEEKTCVEQTLAELAPVLDALEIKEKELAAQRSAVELARQKCTKSEADAQAAADAWATVRSEVERTQVLMQSEAEQLAEGRERMRGLVTGKWSADCFADPKTFIEEVRAFAQLKKEIDGRRELLEREIMAMDASLRQCRKMAGEILKMYPSWAPENRESRTVAGCEGKFAALAARINDNSALHKEASDELAMAKSIVREWVSVNPNYPLRRLYALAEIDADKHEIARNIVDKARADVLQARSVLRDIEAQLEAVKADKPAMPEDFDAEAAGTHLAELDAKIAEALRESGVIAERRENDRKLRLQLSGLLARCEAQDAVARKWSDLNSIFGSADGKKFSKIALRYVLGHLLDKANIYLHRLMPRYSLSCRTDSLVIMVEDAYQNGMARAANVISGGESFVVSLALALALSDFGTRFNIDILFIDEGFGTLSGEALDSAVDTLRTLHSAGGRRVGIISHVAELRERIPVKITVGQNGSLAAATVKVSRD